ncbi:hypothetical protein SAMN04487967_1845 [Natronorubrum sediminis]|uniref:Uncharacterized protein n=1 Tax=Natronorubrum sediminis TaxID=640943 RepID=A0A1H6FVZ0_9EURY|nr:hypothetical protein SAMN04487967_1845 [Natronorubrum sediminis]
MKHPRWRCQRCGERVYEHIEGGYQCHNCERWLEVSELEE